MNDTRAEVVVTVRVRLRGIDDLDEARSLARHLVEKGAGAEAEVGLPLGVKLEGGVECGPEQSSRFERAGEVVETHWHNLT
jgi:hypothetical protein